MLEKFKQFEIQNPIKVFGGSSSNLLEEDQLVIAKYPGSAGTPLT